VRSIRSWMVWSVTVAALTSAASGQAPPVDVPRASTIVVDGTWAQPEWAGAALQRSADIRIAVTSADGFLQIGLRTPPLFVASLCIEQGDTVRVFHASAALGRATYVRTGEQWRLTEDFEWRLRRTDLGPEAAAERMEHRSRFGWVASTVDMGAPGDTEFQISLDYLPATQPRIALGLMLGGATGVVQGWPIAAEEDGCTHEAVIAGSPPGRVRFDATRWARLVIATP